MKRDILIFNPAAAKDLLLQGFQIKNIAPDKQVENATVFFFENSKVIRDYLKKEWDYNFD